MENFIKLLLQTSLSMSVVIILFFIITNLLIKVYHTKTFYYCCIIILLGLIIPFRFININLINVNITDKININNKLNMTPDFETNKILESDNKNYSINDNIPKNSISKTNLYNYIFIIWFSVFILIVLKNIIKHIILLHTINRWSYEVTDNKILDILNDVKKELQINKNIKLKICCIIASPLGIGFFNPIIIIPESEFKNEDLVLFIKHELIHYKRKDLFYKSFIFLVCTIHWFNPIIHFMAKYIEMLCESSCDEEVIKNENIEIKRKYVECIINVVRNKSKFITAFSTNFINGKTILKRRVHNIMIKKKSSNFIVTSLIVIFIIISGNIIAFGKESSNYSNNNEYWKEQKEYWKDSIELNMKPFQKYGITYDKKNDKIFYNGKLVKAFIDEKKDGWCLISFYDFDADSSLYLQSTRDNSDKITGVKTMSEKNISKFKDNSNKQKDNWNWDFEDNWNFEDKSDWENSMELNMKPFQKYGVTYDKEKNKIFYNGEPVKAFIDKNSENWVMVHFYDNNINSSIYLESIRDDNKNITGIKNMSINDIDEIEKLHNEIKINKPESNFKSDKNETRFFTKNADSYIDNNNIKASDKTTKNYAPEQIKNWIKECDKEKGAYFYKLNNDDKLDIWIYYNKGGSYPWNIDYKNGNIEFYLYDMPEINGNEGYTLINCQTLNKKDNIKLYFNDILISSN